MLKEEVLAKSRSEKADEGMENAENKGRKIGFAAFCVIFIVLVLFSVIFNRFETLYAIFALFWAVFSAEAYGKYRFAKHKAYLVTAIAGGIASPLFLTNYILTALNALS